MSIQSKSHHRQSGTVITYLLIALFLIGILTVTMMSGSSINPQTQRLDSLQNQFEADLSRILNGINACILGFPTAIDIDGDGDVDTDDNPNAPYPIYDDNSTGSGGDEFQDILCPGSGQPVFSSARGDFFPLLSNSAEYTVTYFNDSTEGIRLVFDRTLDSQIWLAMVNRIDEQSSQCQAEVDTSTGSCATGACLTYWVRRLSTCP